MLLRVSSSNPSKRNRSLLAWMVVVCTGHGLRDVSPRDMRAWRGMCHRAFDETGFRWPPCRQSNTRDHPASQLHRTLAGTSSKEWTGVESNSAHQYLTFTWHCHGTAMGLHGTRHGAPQRCTAVYLVRIGVGFRVWSATARQCGSPTVHQWLPCHISVQVRASS